MTDTPASQTLTAPVTITDQRATDTTFPYAVTLRDQRGHVCGIGYGQSPLSAYAEARQNFQDAREAETQAMLRSFNVTMLDVAKHQK